MKAMILAAGRGERMRPLTDTCPKPLLTVGGKPLIEYHIEKLAAIGIKEIIINHAWLGEKIEHALGDGNKWGVKIRYSAEQQALETAGGIIRALPLLGNTPFMLVNGDVFCDFDFTDLPSLSPESLVHLWLVNNPTHNVRGDFMLEQGKLKNLSLAAGGSSFTYSGIALFHPMFFQLAQQGAKILPLGPLLRAAADLGKANASILPGRWFDVGTPQRLAELNQV